MFSLYIISIIHTYIYTHIYIYIDTYIYIYTHIYIYTYIYIYCVTLPSNALPPKIPAHSQNRNYYVADIICITSLRYLHDDNWHVKRKIHCIFDEEYAVVIGYIRNNRNYKKLSLKSKSYRNEPLAVNKAKNTISRYQTILTRN